MIIVYLNDNDFQNYSIKDSVCLEYNILKWLVIFKLFIIYFSFFVVAEATLSLLVDELLAAMSMSYTLMTGTWRYNHAKQATMSSRWPIQWMVYVSIKIYENKNSFNKNSSNRLGNHFIYQSNQWKSHNFQFQYEYEWMGNRLASNTRTVQGLGDFYKIKRYKERTKR